MMRSPERFALMEAASKDSARGVWAAMPIKTDQARNVDATQYNPFTHPV
jgi:hypothetical protein